MKIEETIKNIKGMRHMMNERIYRKLIARFYVFYFAEKYSVKSEIQYQVNVKLMHENLKHISYMFVTETLKEN